MIATTLTRHRRVAAPPATATGDRRRAWQAVAGWSGMVVLGALQWAAMAAGLARLLA